MAENAGGPLITSMHGLADTLSSPIIVEAVAAVANVLSGALASAIDFIAGLLPVLIQGWLDIAPAVQSTWEVLQGIGAVFGELANEAGGWGSNIIDQLANGIMAGAQIVMDVLGSIGDMIAGLLMPGSPPKLLPDLDTWGTGAINAYMEGWGKADFSVFSGLSDAIKGQLDSIAKATGNKDMNVASMVLGSQDAIARAINEVHKIVDSAGPAGKQVVDMARAYIDLERSTQDVANAQSELNAITDEYAAKLAPLNADLKKIQDQKSVVQDAIKLQKLNAEIADSKTTAGQRELDQLEILEIQKKQEITSTQDARDVDVAAAKSKLDNAKAAQTQAQQQVESQKGLLDVIKKQNDMIAAQSKETKAAGGAHAGAAAAVAGHASAQANLMATVQSVTTTVQTANAHVTEVATTIRGALAPAVQFVTGQFTSLSQAFHLDGLTGLASQLDTLAAQLLSALLAIDTTIVTQLVRWGQAFVAWAAALLGWIGKEVLPKLPGIWNSFTKATVDLLFSAGQAIGKAALELGANLVAGIKKGVADAWGSFMKWLHEHMMKIPEPIRTALGMSSPSQVMAESVGKPIIQGIMQGMIDAMPELTWATTDIAKKLLEPLQKVADAARQIIASTLAASVSATRQAVTNADSLQAMVDQAQKADAAAGQAMTDAYHKLEEIKAQGDAALADAQKKVDAANALLATAKTPADIAAAQKAVADAQAAFEKAQADAAKANSEAQAAFDDATTKQIAAQNAYNNAIQSQQQAQMALAQAQKEAAVIGQTNAQAGAEYLALRSNQIFALANLEQQRRDAEAAGDGQQVWALTHKIELVQIAQQAELAQFQQHAADLEKAQTDMINQMTTIGTEDGQKAGNAIVEGLIAGLQSGMPGLVDAMQRTMSALCRARAVRRSTWWMCV